MIRDVTCSDPEDLECLPCTAISLTLGTCFSGKHKLEYSVTDADGNTAVAFAVFNVQSSGTVGAETFTISSNATSSQGAQAVANLMKGDLFTQRALAQALLPTKGYNMTQVGAGAGSQPCDAGGKIGHLSSGFGLITCWCW